MSTEKTPVLYTAKQVAGILQIHADDAYRLAKAGLLPSIMIGTRRRFPADQINAYIRKHTSGAVEGV